MWNRYMLCLAVHLHVRTGCMRAYEALKAVAHCSARSFSMREKVQIVVLTSMNGSYLGSRI